jgi:glycosyltransferase involved in cell wall biosynthesis
MQILIATPRFFPEMGGVETHVFQTGKRLVAMGHTVTVLTTDRSGKLPVDEQKEGIHVHRVPVLPYTGDFYFAPDIYSEIVKRDWDILHIQSYHTFVAPFAILAALRVQRSFVLTFHGGGHSSQLRQSMRIFQRFILRPLLARAKKLVAVAEFEIGMFSEELNLPVERFVLIPNGIDLPTLRSEPATRTENGMVIASVGRLERYKGHHRVIAALPHVLKKRPDVRLWIAGSGPYEGELKSLAHRLGVQDKVEIRAFGPEAREKFAEELSKSALFVLFSEYETHPIAALEAIYLGCPVLVADNSGMQELAEKGLAKSLSLSCTDEQLAEVILTQLDHPMIPEKSLQLPTWDDCANGLNKLYRGVVQECAS